MWSKSSVPVLRKRVPNVQSSPRKSPIWVPLTGILAAVLVLVALYMAFIYAPKIGRASCRKEC